MGRCAAVNGSTSSLLVLLVARRHVSGYRRGLALQSLSVRRAPGRARRRRACRARRVAALVESPVAQAAVATALCLIGFGGGRATRSGWLSGSRLRARARATRFGQADAAGGSAVAVVASLLAIWFVALNLVNGPFPRRIATEIRDSAIVRDAGRRPARTAVAPVAGPAVLQPVRLPGRVLRHPAAARPNRYATHEGRDARRRSRSRAQHRPRCRRGVRPDPGGIGVRRGRRLRRDERARRRRRREPRRRRRPRPATGRQARPSCSIRPWTSRSSRVPDHVGTAAARCRRQGRARRPRAPSSATRAAVR